MTSDDERLLSVLASVRDAGASLAPRWSPSDPRGFVYENDGQGGAAVEETDLDRLANEGFLERSYFDRIARCPKCRSHHLNFREVCPSCSSSHLSEIPLLHHFRCGYVGPTYEFGFARDARRCPKCHGKVRDRGTDHDVPGPLSACQSCGATFQAPSIGAVCLGCSHKIVPDQLIDVIYEEIHGYRLTSLGLAALRTRTLVEATAPESILESHLPIHRRETFLAFVDDAQRRQRRFGSKASLILIVFDAEVAANAEGSNEERAVRALQRYMEDTDKIGRYQVNGLLLLLEGAGDRQAKAMEKRLSADADLKEMRARVSVVGFEDGHVVTDALTGLTHAAQRG